MQRWYIQTHATAAFPHNRLPKSLSNKEARYTAADQVDIEQLQRWLAQAVVIQWDYKNLIRRNGRLERLR